MNAQLAALSAWLNTLHAHETIQNHEWIVPTVQSIHILAIATLFTSSLVLALRSFNVSGVDWSPARWGERLNHWTASALVVLLLTGMIMITGEPERSLLSPVFQIKMLLVIAATMLSWLLARRLKHCHDSAGGAEKLIALAIVLLWVGTISAGRWIAYYAG
jgi:hypothetical protein